MTDDFFKILAGHLRESKNPVDSEILKILDGAGCELIEFKIGALFEMKERSFPFRAVFTTENYTKYDSDAYDARLLEVCREIVPQTGVVVADVVVNEPEKSESEFIDCDEFVHEEIMIRCAEDFNSGDYNSAAMTAADYLSELICDSELDKEECIEVLADISKAVKRLKEE